MIDTLYLANYIETQLNANSLGKNFLVYADEGEMRNAKRCCEYKYWTNCLLETISSSITPIKNMTFQTETVQVMFIVDLAETGETSVGTNNRQQSNNLIDVKTCIYEMIERLNGTTQVETIGGKTYSVTLGFGSPTDGQKTQLGEVSEGLPIYLNITMAFFENGVNSNDVHVYVNGEDLFFTRCVISKVNTADQNQFADSSKGGKAYMLTSGKSVDLILPTVSTTVGGLIMQDILENGKNKALDVYVQTPLYSKQFIGTFGNNSVSMDAGANLGYNVSIAEGKESLLKYDNSWDERTFDDSIINASVPAGATNASVLDWRVEGSLTNSAYFAVYWGDGSANNSTQPSQSQTENYSKFEHAYNDENQTHKVRIFKKSGTVIHIACDFQYVLNGEIVKAFVQIL